MKTSTQNTPEEPRTAAETSAEPLSGPEAVLTSMFEKVEPAWREALKSQNRTGADKQVEAWGTVLKGDEHFEHLPRGYPGKVRERHQPGRYVWLASGPAAWSWEKQREAFKAGRYRPKYELAEKDADGQVDAAKLNFLSRIGGKLDSAQEGRTDSPKLRGKLKLEGINVTGWVQADYPGGDNFILDISTTYNYTKNGDPYLQWPARFIQVKHGGGVRRSVPEKRMKEEFK